MPPRVDAAQKRTIAKQPGNQGHGVGGVWVESDS